MIMKRKPRAEKVGSHGCPPRGLLGPFLLNLLESGETEGLEWIDRETGLFKILWMDKRKSVWANKENTLFKKWEIINNRFKEGDEEDWNKWKGTFRLALNHSPCVHAVPEMHQLKSETPFLVYKLKDLVRFGNSDSSSCNRAVTPLNLNVPFDNNGFSQQVHDSQMCNIPNIVIDELKTEDISTNENSEISTNGEMQQELKPMILVVVDHQISNSDYKMNSDDFNGIFEKNFPSVDSVSLPSFNTPEASFEKVKPRVKYQVYYHNQPVLQGALHDIGIHLFFGFHQGEILSELIGSQICGPKEFEQVELPDVKTFGCITNEKYTKMISDILENMKRGLILYCDGGNLLISRYCTTHIFAWNSMGETVQIDRRSKTPRLLFDMNDFKAQLELYKSDPQNGICPSPKVILVFGQACKVDKIISRELLVHLELTYMEAEELLQQELPDRHSAQLSGLDSGDEIIQRCLAMNLGGST